MSDRSITGLNPVQDIICDRLEVNKRIRVDDGTIEIKSEGEIYFRNLPTTQPSKSNRLWNDNGTLKISP
eukprot:SAG31_NODE_11895_length_987_cov_117.479730_1_plen_69_part_00